MEKKELYLVDFGGGKKWYLLAVDKEELMTKISVWVQADHIAQINEKTEKSHCFAAQWKSIHRITWGDNRADLPQLMQ